MLVLRGYRTKLITIIVYLVVADSHYTQDGKENTDSGVTINDLSYVQAPRTPYMEVNRPNVIRMFNCRNEGHKRNAIPNDLAT